MKRFFYLLLITTFGALTSCNKPTDGVYVTYNIKSDDSRFGDRNLTPDDEISSFLKSKLQEKKYEIKFNEKFVTMKDLSENDETILTKEESSNREVFYSTTVNKGRQKLNLKLYQDSKDLILVVDLEVPREVSFIPTQVGGSLEPIPHYGRAICYLSKGQ